jgi:hypothetical protein
MDTSNSVDRQSAFRRKLRISNAMQISLQVLIKGWGFASVGDPEATREDDRSALSFGLGLDSAALVDTPHGGSRVIHREWYVERT